MPRVTVLMDDTTVDQLAASGHRLLACVAVRAAPRGVPLLWFQTGTFAMSTDLAWNTDYAAYTAPAGDGVTLRNTYPADLGATLLVTAATGTGRVEAQGAPGALTVLNQTTTGFGAGLAQSAPDGRTAPVCAIPLFGGTKAVVEPLPRVFLEMTAQPRATGLPLTAADGPGVLIDLDPAGRTIHFDLNSGWSPTGPWAEAVPTGTALGPLLVTDRPP
ncbi:hypothetical protein ACTG9Q_15070 [Actinokineospora sp. 24-640]